MKIYDYLIVLNKLNDKNWFLNKYGLNEKEDNIYIVSINQRALDGLKYNKILMAPNLDITTFSQLQTFQMLKMHEGIYKGYK